MAVLFQEELVRRALVETGQVYFDPSVIHFDDDTIRDTILLPCLKEYSSFRPPVIWEHISLPSDGWVIPSRVRRINGLRPLWLYYWPYEAAVALRPIPRIGADNWFQTDGVLYAAPGRYELEYIANDGYKLGRAIEDHQVYEPHGIERNLKFKLRGHLVPGTLKLTALDSNTVEMEAVDDANGAITGSWVDHGVIDYETLQVTLTTNQAIDKPILASFYSKYPAVQGMDFSELYFFQLFQSKFLPAFAAARTIVRLEGVPIDLNIDDLLAYARQKEESWNTISRDTKQSWWRW
jgi:hypothetical protein